MAGNFIALISVIGLAGVDMSYVRSYHSKSGSSGSAIEVFAWKWVLIAGAFLGALLFLCWQPIARLLNLPHYLGGLLGGGIILSLVNTMSQARARLNNRYRTMSVALIASSIGSIVISILVAYGWRQDELPLILSMLMGYAITILILGIPLPNRLCQPSNMSTSKKLNFLKIGLAGTITAPAYWLISSSDRWFLGYLMDSSSVGIYSMAYSVGILGMMVNNAVLSVWTSEAAKEFEYNVENACDVLGKTANYIVAAYMSVWIVVSAIGGDIVRLLAAPAFHDAAGLIPFIAGAVFFHGLIHLFNSNLLLVGRLEYAIRWWFVGAIISISLNIILIPSLGGLGAAVTQAVTMGIISQSL
jgi:O-antigen/teichoic acid export membrane protein